MLQFTYLTQKQSNYKHTPNRCIAHNNCLKNLAWNCSLVRQEEQAKCSRNFPKLRGRKLCVLGSNEPHVTICIMWLKKQRQYAKGKASHDTLHVPLGRNQYGCGRLCRLKVWTDDQKHHHFRDFNIVNILTFKNQATSHAHCP